MHPILGAIVSYLTSVWTMARLIFSALDRDLMINCIELLGVVYMIWIIDTLPGKVKDKIEKRLKKKEVKDDDVQRPG